VFPCVSGWGRQKGVTFGLAPSIPDSQFPQLGRDVREASWAELVALNPGTGTSYWYNLKLAYPEYLHQMVGCNKEKVRLFSRNTSYWQSESQKQVYSQQFQRSNSQWWWRSLIRRDRHSTTHQQMLPVSLPNPRSSQNNFEFIEWFAIKLPRERIWAMWLILEFHVRECIWQKFWPGD